MPLLDIDNLRTWFYTRNGVVRAVDGVSLQVEPGETLGIVGESGSGKSVANLSYLGLVPSPPGRIVSGTAMFDGIDLIKAPGPVLRSIRGKRISMIFQDPMTALNPYMTVGKQVMEPLLVHDGLGRAEAADRAVQMLESVGLQDAAGPEARMRAYPHQLSGGMRQRVMIAMALVTHPQLLIADEPTTALDVTVQAQILELIKQMQQRLGTAMILITHNLGVIAGTCDRVLVMYAGRFLESATTRDLFYSPRHPYTRALMDSMPSARKPGEDLYTIPGLPPELTSEIVGCPFAPRCAHAKDVCRRRPALLQEVAPNHATACTRVQAGEL
ncbi:MAG: ABC transporter ATP-binding protein [Candidatus Hydrogenedentes bacterium]|nr:ABC transporter ATP-binding protein [Candidatus Hydrogenedentota bacterium]